MPPPPFILSETPIRTEPLPDPPLEMTCDYRTDTKRLGATQTLMHFRDGKSYTVLRGMVQGKDCEVGWGKVIKGWGSRDEVVMAKYFELLFNTWLSEE